MVAKQAEGDGEGRDRPVNLQEAMVIRDVENALAGLDYGEITITVRSGKVIQIERVARSTDVWVAYPRCTQRTRQCRDWHHRNTHLSGYLSGAWQSHSLFLQPSYLDWFFC